MDGIWARDTSDLVGFDQVYKKEDYSPMYRSQSYAWTPNTCRLRVFTYQELQQAMKGLHFHFAGDSTVFELMYTIMRMVAFSPSLEGIDCGEQVRKNRR